MGCAQRLRRARDVRVTLIDRHNYHQFQPLLYQVATSQLAPSDIAFSLRKLFRDDENVDVKLGEVIALDPRAHGHARPDGERIAGDALVLAAGSQPNFFRTPGADAALPLYSLDDASGCARGSSRSSRRPTAIPRWSTRARSRSSSSAVARPAWSWRARSPT